MVRVPTVPSQGYGASGIDLNLPALNITKQIPYRPILQNVLEPGDMEDGPLVPANHYFTQDMLNATINSNHFFDDDTARDSYFSAHPGELVDQVLVFCTTTGYNRYTTAFGWNIESEYDLVTAIATAYFTAHPSELVDGARRCMITFMFGTQYEKYSEILGYWDLFTIDEFALGWIFGSQGPAHLPALTEDLTNQHSGTKCLKATYTLESWSDFYGGGISIQGVDLTNATHVSIWVKGVGDAIGKYITEINSCYSSEQEISGEWAQYTFEVATGNKAVDQTLTFLVGEHYADPNDNYEVYFDDCTLIGPVQPMLLWSALETLLAGMFVEMPASDNEYTDDKIAVYHPLSNMLKDADFLLGGAGWTTYSYSSAGVTPAVSNVVTSFLYEMGLYERKIAFSVSSDGSTGEAFVSHRQILTNPLGDGDGSVTMKFFCSPSYSLDGITFTIEKLGTDGTTVLGQKTIDLSGYNPNSWQSFTFTDLDDVAPGAWGGIGFRLNIAHDAYIPGNYIFLIREPYLTDPARIEYETYKQTNTKLLSGAEGWSDTTLPDAGFVQFETATNDVNIRGTSMVASSDDQNHEWGFQLPEDYDGGPITAVVHFFVPSSTDASNHTIIFNIQACAHVSMVIMDIAWGTAQSITQIVATSLAGRHVQTESSPEITIGGIEPMAGQWCQVRLTRDGDDTYAGDIIIMGLVLTYNKIS